MTLNYTYCINSRVTTTDYRAALAAAIREYEALGEQRRDIDKRLAQLAHTIGTLSRLLGLTPTVPMGLTDAIRLVIRGAGVPMTPVDVRDRLHAIGFDVSKYSNDLAAVHTILKRLNHTGELRFIARAPGKHQYTWNRPVTPVALGPDILAFMRDNAHEHEARRAADSGEDPRPPARSRQQRLRPHPGPQRGSRAGATQPGPQRGSRAAVARRDEDEPIGGDVSAKARGEGGAPPPLKKSRRK